MNHQEIRFEILHYLYNKHYGEMHQPQIVENMIQQTQLKNLDKNIVYGDIVYLEQSGYIKGEYIIGYTYPPWITITNYGIDTVDNVTNRIINEIANDKLDEHTQTEIKTISSEPDPKSKMNRAWEYAKTNPGFFGNIIEKVLRLVLGGGSPN